MTSTFCFASLVRLKVCRNWARTSGALLSHLARTLFGSSSVSHWPSGVKGQTSFIHHTTYFQFLFQVTQSLQYTTAFTFYFQNTCQIDTPTCTQKRQW